VGLYGPNPGKQVVWKSQSKLRRLFCLLPLVNPVGPPGGGGKAYVARLPLHLEWNRLGVEPKLRLGPGGGSAKRGKALLVARAGLPPELYSKIRMPQFMNHEIVVADCAPVQPLWRDPETAGHGGIDRCGLAMGLSCLEGEVSPVALLLQTKFLSCTGPEGFCGGHPRA
jgi:hypothetical protein